MFWGQSLARPARIWVASGEASGDRLAVSLLGAFRRQGADIVVRGTWGPGLESFAGKPEVSSVGVAAIGVGDTVRRVPSGLRVVGRTITEILRWRPDVVVTVDSPSLWIRPARILRQLGFPVVHWGCPQVWAWRAYRRPRIAASVDALLCLFPFETRWFAGRSCEVVYTGHPRVAELVARPKGRLGPEAPLTVALLPGSRIQEIQRLWPKFQEIAGDLSRCHPGVRFVIPVAPGGSSSVFYGVNAMFVDDIAKVCAHVALVCTGTATLELAALGIPMVAVYRTDPFTFELGRRLIRVPYLALPNLLMGREVVPEFVQNLPREAIVDALISLSGPAGEAQRNTFPELTAPLCVDAGKIAAEVVLRYAHRGMGEVRRGA